MSGWIRQCPAGRVYPSLSLVQFFLFLAHHRFSKLSYAILCICLPSDWPAGGTLAMTPPPMTVQAEEMISLSLRLIQEGKQENKLVVVKQVPLKPMRKLPTGLKVMPSMKQGRQGKELKFKRFECPLRPGYEYTLRRVDR
jgi:hypothetical protein